MTNSSMNPGGKQRMVVCRVINECKYSDYKRKYYVIKEYLIESSPFELKG